MRAAETRRRWNAANADKITAYAKKYSETNREKIRERMKAWAAAHPEQIRASYEKYRSIHKDRILERARLRHDANPGLRQEKHRRVTYGMSAGEYDRLLAAQDGACAICNKPPAGRRLEVDHDHRTLEIRGLLCRGCNVMVGLADDDIEVLDTAIAYLARSRRPRLVLAAAKT